MGKQMGGYGVDTSCDRAAAMIRKICKNDDLAVHFLVGGTQTNLTVIAAALRPHQAAIGADTAHINVHETGAIEATGHKVIGLPTKDGKITAAQVENAVNAHFADEAFEHIPQPKMVYISNPTELGTIYSLAELEALSEVCKAKKLYLFVDGARLGYGLAAKGNDVTFADLARLTDVFYIGGTKVGALFGEAVVISNPVLAEDFRYIMKQHGAMLAKGWLLGLQYEALLEDDLYLKIAAHADELAERIREVLSELGYSLFVEGVTNQIFPILPDALLDQLKGSFTFSEQKRVDESHRAVRFCTSWATTQEAVDELCNELRKLSV
ncbi:MAG: aminotransferase class I/II-fold pyridoxal phosphate-dependent enzyme [Firmicutes bacterium]|nr:aminotransferase class I/II-fold pyridoxal phosphate-dependent enzyme [Bacillota bacterium]